MSEWKCWHCSTPAPDRKATCECATAKLYRRTVRSLEYAEKIRQ